MECTVCKSRNYFTTKNRRKHPERAEWKKFCPFGVLPPVLGREIVPAFAHRAFHDDVFSWHLNLVGSTDRRIGGWSSIRRSDHPPIRLFQDFRDHSSTNRSSTFSDSEPQLLFHRDRRDQLDRHLRVVPRHHHLDTGGQLHRARHVRRAEVELRPIALEERRMPPALFLRQ